VTRVTPGNASITDRVRVDQASLAFVLLALFGAPDADAARIDALQERHRLSVASPAGKEYEAKAAHVLAADASLLRECAPAGAGAEPLTLWLAIEEDGRLSDLAVSPETPVAKCVRRRVADRVFPAPPAALVARVELPFRR
jgi:hypothetical protein